MTRKNVVPEFIGAEDVLLPFLTAHVLSAGDAVIALGIARRIGEHNPVALLGLACACAAVRLGHVCVPVRHPSLVFEELANMPGELELWPTPEEWDRALVDSPTVRTDRASQGELLRPLVYDAERLYLERFWSYEVRLAERLLDRAEQVSTLAIAASERERVLNQLFPIDDEPLQRAGVERALTGQLAILIGGPGTGKTHTIARLMAALNQLSAPGAVSIALAAPTGKAAQRMSAAIGSELGISAEDHHHAVTLHSLLGYRPGGGFRHDARNPLRHDVVIVDEVSMVSLPLMYQLVEAMRPGATLVLVGDPYQLASVEAGAVLEALVTGEAGRPSALAEVTTQLAVPHRFSEHSASALLSAAVRRGAADEVLALLDDPNFEGAKLIEPENDREIMELVRQRIEDAVAVVNAVRLGDIEDAFTRLTRLKVLCGSHHQQYGSNWWTTEIERGLEERGLLRRSLRGFYLGRPLLVTRNDPINRLFNGDPGVVIDRGEHAVIASTNGMRTLSISQLSEVDSWWAMTVHKSQGSEFAEVIVTLPTAPSPLLTRELLYTAVTRAREDLVIVASRAAIEAAVTNPSARSSGLAARLTHGVVGRR